MLTKLLSLLLLLVSLGQSAVDAYVDEMNLGGNLFLVNRTYTLASDYVPPDLETPNVRLAGEHVRMRLSAARALERLFQAAEEAGYELYAVSGYRSYSLQRSIHSNRISQLGREKAQRISAPAGASEHQLGLAMDLSCKAAMHLTEKFGETPEGQWVAENCWRNGFIIRYKAEWEEVTGYANEPWHIRYVGLEHAARIAEMNIPFEYYIEQLRQARFALISAEKE